METRKLRRWLEKVSDPLYDPWPEQFESTNDDDVGDVGVAALIDPTAVFDEVTDDFCWTDEDDISEEESELASFTYRGKKDAQGRFDEYGTLTFDNGDVVRSEFCHGIRHGEAVITSERNKISMLCGNYVNGKLQGRGKIVSVDTAVTECFFLNGAIHGPVRRFVMKKFREFRQQLDFVGYYRHGRPHGYCWQYKEGGGYLTGEVDPHTGNFTGDNLAFMYPDLYTAYVGKFKDGIMVSGQATSLKSVEFISFLVKAIFEEPLAQVPKVAYTKSTKTFIGANRLVPDPYESRTVTVETSNVDNAGSGLFALKDMCEGTVVAFYNGVRLPYRLGGPKDEWETSGYKIYINADYASGERMDIPDEYVDTQNYCATLGHKLNHSFRANCSEWFFDHPRFGLVPCERTNRPVKRGEELFLDYEYDPYNCPDWFRQELIAFKASLTEEEEVNLSERYARFVPDL